MLATNRELSQKLHALERKVSKHDASIVELIDAIQKLLATPEVRKRPIGFITPHAPSNSKAIKSASNAKSVSVKK